MSSPAEVAPRTTERDRPWSAMLVTDAPVGCRAGTDIAPALVEAGFAITRVTSGPEAERFLRETGADLIVADGAGSPVEPMGVPVIYLVDLAQTDAAASVTDGENSDWVSIPACPREVARRALALVSRTHAAAEKRAAAEALREAFRHISTDIRSTNEPDAMTEAMVAGLGETLGVDRVWFTTFYEEGVPPMSAAYPTHVGDEENRPIFDHEKAKQVATRLWEKHTTLLIENVDAFPADAPGGQLAEWARVHHLRSVAAFPVGDLGSVLGVIIVATVDETRKWAPLEASLTSHVAQNLAYGIMQGRLIAGQEQLVKRLGDLDRAKSEMMATLNHELRTPLTSVAGYLEITLDGDGGDIPEDAAAMLGVVRHNVTRLQGLVDDMLTMSRLEAGIPSATAVPIHLDKLISRVIEAIQPFAAGSGVALGVEVQPHDEHLPVVFGDEMQLERAFTNITDNAVKFTPSAGSVQVSIAIEHEHTGLPVAVVRVTDTGMGIPEGELPQLFTRFFRASNATAAATPGTGLGLAIVRSLIEAHDGEIAVTSEISVGTTVAVRLPVLTTAP
ncbi:sensor histidine kinase [Marisediminicola senii]|uniref:sensor histidine kinase n=1 Tax=Marisediminicola senii TaxID=2711233 RepID=UPI0013EAC74B|nr:GAF domain-containing sensor histidine kinase [Marisediminicola senii]